MGAVLSSDVGTFLQMVAAINCFPAECDEADQAFADDADDLLRFSINSSYYSLMGDFCQNALSSSASSAKAPQCSRAEPRLLNGEKLMSLSGRGLVDCIHGGGNFLHITATPRAYTYKPVAVGG